MADGPFGAKEIVIDLADTGARVIRTARETVKVLRIRIKGAAGAAGENNDIVLRKKSASGPIIWSLRPVDTEAVNDTFEVGYIGMGLFMDNLVAAWTQASGTTDPVEMIITTA